MAYLIVEQSPPLKGRVQISGSKNAILPIIAATLLVEGETVLQGVPDLRDVQVMIELLRKLGAVVEFEGETLKVDATEITSLEAPYDLVNKMRASFLVMGSLLSRYKEAKVSMPGGCSIGARPIDLHLKGFESLGAKVSTDYGYIESKADRLVGDVVYLDFPSVGATENIIMAATLAEGDTIIENAAEEPEIVDLANFINKMGGKIRGAGTNTIKIRGVQKLEPVEHTVIPDRIEAGTFMLAAAVTQGDIVVENVIVDHLKPLIAKLIEAGCEVDAADSSIRVIGKQRPRAVNIKTLPYPGFPTDLQSPFMTLLCIADGRSQVTETVFENRYMNVPELVRMGGEIEVNGKMAIVTGVDTLKGAEVAATDLRAGVALVLAGLVADGKTKVKNIYHIDRGYVDVVGKFRNLGAIIHRVDDED